MGRVYHRKVGGRQYRNWTEETLQLALKNIKAKKISVREATKRFVS